MGADIRALLFDLDGTLVDSIPDLHAACVRMMAELGRAPHALDATRRFVGKGMQNLVRRCLAEEPGRETPPGDAEVDAAVAVFRRHYAAVNGDESRVYPGVVEALDALRAQGVALACVTNKPAEFTAQLLARCGLAEYFAATVAGDTLPRKKPDPAPLAHACALLGVPVAAAGMVGDSANDALAARAAGLPVWLVTYGYSEGIPVDSIECDGLLSSLAELPPRLQRIGISPDRTGGSNPTSS